MNNHGSKCQNAGKASKIMHLNNYGQINQKMIDS